MEEIRKQIIDLLDGVLVFEPDFKDKILAKIMTLSEEKLRQLKDVLGELADWQDEIIVKMLNQNPDLYKKILYERINIEKEIMAEYKAKVAIQDKDKISIILDKIQSL